MATDPNAIQLTAEQIMLLGQASSRTGKPPQQVLSEALRQYQTEAAPSVQNTPNGESLYDKLIRKGLIGCLSGGPPDLSTNPTYMKGFGE